MFWLDEALESRVKLDGIVTVVDSLNIDRYLAIEKKEDDLLNKPRDIDIDNLNVKKEHAGDSKGTINEATKQIALADRIILNKSDLISVEQMEVLKGRIQGINGTAQIVTATRSRYF